MAIRSAAPATGRWRSWFAEDLELLAASDLEERIEALEGEIVRTRAQLERKRAGRAAADAFFAKPG